MTDSRFNGALRALLTGCRRTLAAMAVAVLFCLPVLPAFAHDDDGPPAPPSAESLAVAARMTTLVFALGAGIAVYYGMQRHRLINSSSRSPQWDRKMNRNAVIYALVALVGVAVVSTVLTRPAPKGAATASPAAPTPTR